MYTASRPKSRAAVGIYRASLLWADGFKPNAGCTKLLEIPGKLNMWDFVFGDVALKGRFFTLTVPLRSAKAEDGLRNPGVRRPQN